MESTESTSPVRKRLIAGAVALGTVFGAAGIASATTGGGSTTDETVQSDDSGTTAVEADENHNEANEADEHGGMGDETPLTGTVADKVTAAALAAVPGGTIDRVETDAQGAAYEAHMTDADGNEVNVTFDENFEVVETLTGHGGRGGGDHDGPGERGGHDETPLTGTQADEVTAAAEAAVPGGTVDQVEADGTGFEAHVTDADGNQVEVHFDQDMNVLDVQQGH